MPAASSKLVWASGTRNWSVPNSAWGLSSHHSRGSPTAPARAPQRSSSANDDQVSIAGGTPWRGIRSAIFGRTDEVGVTALVVGALAAGRDLGEVAAHRVVDPKRSICPADGDVHLQRRDELAARDASVLVANVLIALG